MEQVTRSPLIKAIVTVILFIGLAALFAVLLHINENNIKNDTRCLSYRGIEGTDIFHYYPAVFVISTKEKDDILQFDKLIPKSTNGVYCDTYSVAFYKLDTYVSVTKTFEKGWLEIHGRIYSLDDLGKYSKLYEKLKKMEPEFYVFYKKYDFYLDYENDIHMEVLCNISIEKKETYAIHHNLLILSSPVKWKKVPTSVHGVALPKPSFKPYSWVNYCNNNLITRSNSTYKNSNK
jgi:hypothetical protein